VSVFWLVLYQGYAPSSPTVVFTGSANRYNKAAIKEINFSNNAYTSAKVWVWGLPSGTTDPTDAYLIVPGWVLPAADATKGGSSRQWTGFHVVMDGDTVVVAATPGDQIGVQIMGGYQK
jgi:hypothetical protein